MKTSSNLLTLCCPWCGKAKEEHPINKISITDNGVLITKSSELIQTWEAHRQLAAVRRLSELS